ncbi:hypothetical protein ACFOW4_23725 [Micromonospora sp. GCM10011542]|uniref:hypothetical protein n=1 Tax=Micromonospora sp. GCM10011542 TaxID=3317337 RepID=UPI003622AF08
MEIPMMLGSRIGRRRAAVGLAVLAAIAAVLSALAIPVRSTIRSAGPQGVEFVRHDWSPVMSIIVILQVVAAVLVLAAAVCVVRQQTAWAKRLLLAGARGSPAHPGDQLPGPDHVRPDPVVAEGVTPGNFVGQS